jgi:hypothetical protein
VVKSGLGNIVTAIPIAVEEWPRSWQDDRSHVRPYPDSTSPYVMLGRAHPVVGSGYRDGDPYGPWPGLRTQRNSQARRKVVARAESPVMTSWRSGEAELCS